ncbi:MBL fold metallo-hydrolase [Skermanella mucosa]|uniref:MBL fold metallo-hydrolase n=1 Tax=Skermanella mucosa TaxID=1789672 RepID=UPI00192AE853|nr:MBL fold metallo-hydrolase [Skermanella mucosa]UEM23772.1 MBL fold metallo-hydrolase [Skermanella mucosa]
MPFQAMFRRLIAGILTFLAGLAGPSAAMAMCQPVASGPGTLLHLAAIRQAAAPAAGSLRLTFLGHSSFLIESPEDVSAVTDYNGYLRPDRLPDIVTMNNAHSTHYTDRPDPGIRHVLRGWGDEDGMAVHDVTLRDMRVRNVPTNVRDYGGTRVSGNSIFVFEAGGLCVAHLGHLHHTLTDMHLAELGVIDVLLVPVDGSYTMAQDYMVEVIAQIQPALVVPMHYFNASTLAGFLQRMGGTYEVRTSDSATVTLSRQTLPYRQILVLPGH